MTMKKTVGAKNDPEILGVGLTNAGRTVGGTLEAVG